MSLETKRLYIIQFFVPTRRRRLNPLILECLNLNETPCISVLCIYLSEERTEFSYMTLIYRLCLRIVSIWFRQLQTIIKNFELFADILSEVGCGIDFRVASKSVLYKNVCHTSLKGFEQYRCDKGRSKNRIDRKTFSVCYLRCFILGCISVQLNSVWFH